MHIPDAVLRGLRRRTGLRLWLRAPLAPFTTIGVGGPAALLVVVEDAESLANALWILQQEGLPWTVLGAGSNLLVADRGYPGVVFKLGDGFHYVDGSSPKGNTCSLVAGAGLTLPRLALVAAEDGLSGLEFACGIPGTVGGGVVMNAGIPGGCLADIVQRLEIVTAEGVTWLDAAELSWGYRFCHVPELSIITAVRVSLTDGEREIILRRHRQHLRLRLQSQPRGVRTFGSTFKNPPGRFAGRLLDGAGVKGLRRGGAEVSSVHANFIVNVGGASAQDVFGLMYMMREAVRRRHDVELEPEVQVLGQPYPWSGLPAGG